MKQLFLALAIGLTAMGCRDRETEPQDQLPPITQHGANTAGCLVNGKVLIPKDGSYRVKGGRAYGLTTGAGNDFHPPTIGNDYMYFNIINFVDESKGNVYIYIPNLSKGKGVYVIGQSNGEYFPYGPKNPHIIYKVKKNGGYKTYYSYENCGTINITRFDYYEGIYSAIFSAELYNKDNPNDKVSITEGRIDIKISTLNK